LVEVFTLPLKKGLTRFWILDFGFFDFRSPFSFGLGYEIKIAGMREPSGFHVLASEVLAYTHRQHPIACPSLTSIKITLLKPQRYDSLLAVKR
jgi:hypothetical protein